MKKAFLQLHVAVLLAGFTGILGNLIELNEGIIVWYRMGIATLAMFLVIYFSGKNEHTPLKEKVKISGIGILSAIHWVFFFASIKYSNVSIALVCFSAVSFFTAFLEPLINRTRINFIEVLFGLFSIAGIYVIFHFDIQYQTGIILGLIAAFLAGLFPVYQKKALKTHSWSAVLTWQMAGGFIFLTLLMPFYIHYFSVEKLLPDAYDWWWLLVLALPCSVLAFYLSLNSLKQLSAFTVGISYNLEPIYGILLAFTIFKENRYLGNSFYTGIAIIGLTLILHAFYLKTLQKSPD